MTDQIEFQLFNVLTRRLMSSHRRASCIALVEQQARELGEGEDEGNLSWVFGHWDADTHYVDENGQVMPFAEFSEQLALPPGDHGDGNG